MWARECKGHACKSVQVTPRWVCVSRSRGGVLTVAPRAVAPSPHVNLRRGGRAAQRVRAASASVRTCGGGVRGPAVRGAGSLSPNPPASMLIGSAP